ncbi:MAG: hypothetical protein ACP5XB_23915 [Isosphaeraceae bacterium]
MRLRTHKPSGRGDPACIRLALSDKNPDVARALVRALDGIESAGVLEGDLLNLVGSLAVPGLCTGVGWMPAEESAAQMRAAYLMIVGGGWRAVFHAAQAPFVVDRARHQGESPEPEPKAAFKGGKR